MPDHNNISDVLKNCVRFQRSNAVPMFEMNPFDYSARITERLAIMARDNFDEAFLQALKIEMEQQNINGALIINKQYVRELVRRCEQRVVIPVEGILGLCPCCGEEMYPKFNSAFCGKCGQHITWEAKRGET